MEKFYRRLVLEAELLVAADAAAEWCVSLGRDPDLAVGDFDSASPHAVERLEARGVPVSAFPEDKDASDLELAVDAARQRGARALTLTAAFSARIDHTLAAFGTLAAAADLDAEAREPGFAAWGLDGTSRPTLSLALAPGAVLSVLALGEARGVTLTGMRFPLREATLGPLSSLGISNVAQDAVVSVSLAEGRLVVVALDPAARTLTRAEL